MQGRGTSGGSSATIDMVGEVTLGGLVERTFFMDCTMWDLMVSLDSG